MYHYPKSLTKDLASKAQRFRIQVLKMVCDSQSGHLGSALSCAEIVTESCPVPVQRVGIADRFVETGPCADLLDHYGMSVDDILRAARPAPAAKKGPRHECAGRTS